MHIVASHPKSPDIRCLCVQAVLRNHIWIRFKQLNGHLPHTSLKMNCPCDCHAIHEKTRDPKITEQGITEP